MSNELKIFAINNVTFKQPLSSKKAFKEYKEIKNKERIDKLKNIIRDNPTLDLIEDGAPIGGVLGEIRMDIGSGKTIFDILGNSNKNDNK